MPNGVRLFNSGKASDYAVRFLCVILDVVGMIISIFAKFQYAIRRYIVKIKRKRVK